MSYWKIAVVCLLTVSALADLDNDYALSSDFVKSQIEALKTSTVPVLSIPIARPVTPIVKPATSNTKPVIPVTKPVTPVAPVTKPVKPVTPVAKSVTPAKPVTKPVTPVAPVPPVAPVTKPVTPMTSVGSVAADKSYISKLWNLENAAKVGYDKKAGMWTGNAASEKGGNTDYGPGLKLPTKAGGYTQTEIDKALTEKITGIEAKLRKNVASLGKNYDNLSDSQKKLLVDYSYNTGNAFSVFPKFSKAVVEGDITTMNSEYKRTWVDNSGTKQELAGRNEWAKSVIDSMGK